MATVGKGIDLPGGRMAPFNMTNVALQQDRNRRRDQNDAPVDDDGGEPHGDM